MIIITRQIEQAKSKQAFQTLTQTQTELNKVKNACQKSDNCVIKIAKRLGIKEKDKNFTYEGIYRAFEEKFKEK